jgi:hypothetical protein
MNEPKLPEITKEQYKEAAGIVETIAGQKYQPDVLVMDWYCKQLERKVTHQRAAMEAMAWKIRNSGRNLCEIEGLCPHAPNSGACVHSPCPTTDDIIAWAEEQVKGERT